MINFPAPTEKEIETFNASSAQVAEALLWARTHRVTAHNGALCEMKVVSALELLSSGFEFPIALTETISASGEKAANFFIVTFEERNNENVQCEGHENCAYWASAVWSSGESLCQECSTLVKLSGAWKVEKLSVK